MTVGRNGAFQEYLIVDGREAVLVPDNMSLVTSAPYACAGMTSWRGVKQCELNPGDWIAIVGSGGGLGHLAVQFAKKVFGLRVVGVDAKDEALDLSRELGADVVIDGRIDVQCLVEEVRKHTDGKGVHATLNVSGATAAVPIATGVTRDHGCVVQVGLVGSICNTSNRILIRMCVGQRDCGSIPGHDLQGHQDQGIMDGLLRRDPGHVVCCCSAQYQTGEHHLSRHTGDTSSG